MSVLTAYGDVYASLDILKSYSAQSPQSAFLLSGEDADGLATLARFLAARLLGIGAERALDEHADVSVYPRSASEQAQNSAKTGKTGKKADTAKSAPLNVDDIKDILDSLYLTPFEYERRIYIIENAESMSEICQNKLLKSLEEPPSRVAFILCACGGLLPTVESRCTPITLAPFDIGTVESLLRDRHRSASPDSVALAARASRGNLGIAERILNDKSFASAYGDAVEMLSTATGSRVFAKASAVYDKFTREYASAVLGIAEYLLGDVVRVSVGAASVFDRADIEKVSVGFTALSAARSAEFVREANKKLMANCMPQAVLDGLILKIMEEKALCRK